MSGMETITITGLTLQCDSSNDRNKYIETMELLEAINSSIANMDGNPHIGTIGIDESQIEITEDESAEDDT